jgi:hypothetical protein
VDDFAGSRATHHAARHAARPGWLLCAGRPLSAAVIAADDRDPRRNGRSRRGVRGLPAAGSDGGVRRARGGSDRAVPDWRGACRGRAGVWNGVDPAGRQDRGPRERVRCRSEGPGRVRMRHRFLRGPERDRGGLGHRQSFVDRRRPDRAGRARSRRPRDSVHTGPEPGGGGRQGDRAAVARDGPRGSRAAQQRRHHRGGHARRRNRPLAASCARARGLRQRRGGAAPDACRYCLRRLSERAGVRRLRHRLESRAPDQRRRRGPRRPQRRRLRPRLVSPADRSQGPRYDRPGGGRTCRSGGADRARRFGPDTARWSYRIQKIWRRLQPSG